MLHIFGKIDIHLNKKVYGDWMANDYACRLWLTHVSFEDVVGTTLLEQDTDFILV